MSLLNDVLRDLDNARSNGRGLNGAPAVAETPKKKSLLLPILAAIALLYLCVVELNLLGVMPEAEVFEVPPPIALNGKWLARLEEIKAETARQQLEAESAGPAAVPSQIQKVDPSPHTEATTPATFNPALIQPAAVSGLDVLLERASLAQEQNQPQQALQLYQSVLLLVPGHPQAEAGVAALRAAETRPTPVEPVAEQPMQPPLLAVSKPAPTVIAAEAQPVKVAQNLTGIDELFAKRLQGNDWRRHEPEALAWLKEGASFEQTALALIDIYGRAGDVAAVNRVTESLLARASPLKHISTAWNAWLLRDHDAAVSQLQEAAYQGTAEQMRLRLLGGWLQQLQRYGEAAGVYGVLVAYDSAHHQDWLGLAVALDASNRPQEALAAYHQTRRRPHNEPKINAFVEQRIRNLSSLTPSR